MLRPSAHPDLCVGRQTINGALQPELTLVPCYDPKQRAVIHSRIQGAYYLCEEPVLDGPCIYVGGPVKDGASLLLSSNARDSVALTFE